MRLILSILAIAAAGSLAAAQGVPQFDAAPGCRAGANSGVSARNDADACMKSEMDARAQLVREWGTFAAADRTRCSVQTQVGGPPSYIEVLTCLESSQLVRKIPKDDNTGLSIGQRR